MSYFATRVLFEYDRLVQWGKVCGLFAASSSDPERNYDTFSLFRNLDHVTLVQRSLGHFKDLIEDSVSLSNKYDISIVGNRPVILAEQRLLGEKLDKNTGRFTTTAKRGFMRLDWVIKVREGFENLLKNLGQLNDDLYGLHSSDIIRAIIRDHGQRDQTSRSAHPRGYSKTKS